MFSLLLLYINRIVSLLRTFFVDTFTTQNLLSPERQITVPVNINVNVRRRVVSENVDNEEMVGVIKLFSGNFSPKGWKFCDGSLLLISEYPHLYSVIGTSYGGDGVRTFALPDFRGRVPVGSGAGKGLTPRSLGQIYGEETIIIDVNNLPICASDTTSPMGGIANHTVTERPGRPVDNMQPSITINYIICCEGVTPEREEIINDK